MINKVHIKNFKSIKDLELDCSRVNIFIGEPNTGKSNILEALGIISIGNKNSYKIKDYVRVGEITNLFYNNVIDEPISVEIDNPNGINMLTINYLPNSELEFVFADLKENKKLLEIYIGAEMQIIRSPQKSFQGVPPILFYRYKERENYPSKNLDYLDTPDGANLLTLIQSRKKVKEFVLDLFSKYEYKIQPLKDLNKIFFYVDYHGELVTLPYHQLSDTLQRMIFYYTAVELGSETALVLEEPEAHVFPFYNKFLAERIALYNSNQFFIATHNPTFLANIIEQTPDNELKVFITYYEDYQTKIFELSGEKLMQIYQIYGVEIYGNLEEIVTNLDKILKEESQNNK